MGNSSFSTVTGGRRGASRRPEGGGLTECSTVVTTAGHMNRNTGHGCPLRRASSEPGARVGVNER